MLNNRRLAPAIAIVGLAGLIAGIVGAGRDEIPLLQRTNPIIPDAESIAIGEAIYREACVICHGPGGLGNGPLAATLNPRPSNLAIHMVPGIHTDGQLLEWITNGFPNSAMPSFEESYDEDERWHLINYIRTLALEEGS
jgi:mono/diheme cytochrome c family protein